MAAPSANIIVDEVGIPVPQYKNPVTGLFEESYGEQGALNMNMQVFLKDLTPMTIATTDTTDTVADITTFALEGNMKYTTAQIYIASSNNIIAASIVTSVTINSVATEMVIIRKAPISTTITSKSITIMLDPKVNAALPHTWFLRVATEKDETVARVVNAAYQYIR